MHHHHHVTGSFHNWQFFTHQFWTYESEQKQRSNSKPLLSIWVIKSLDKLMLTFQKCYNNSPQVQGQCKTGSSTFAHNFPQVYWYTKPSRYKPTLHVYKVIFINLITNKTKNKNMFLMQNKPLSCNCWSPIYRFMQKQNKKQFCIITEYILITESVVRTYQIWQLSQARVGDTE